MTTDEEFLIRRAVDAIQVRAEEESTEWPAVSTGVRERVRRSPLMTRPVHAEVDGLSGATVFSESDSLTVSDRVVVDALRSELGGIPGVAAESISLDLDGRDCVGVRIELVAGYGTDLRATGERVRTTLESALLEVIGLVAPVEVTVIDVVVDDPSR